MPIQQHDPQRAVFKQDLIAAARLAQFVDVAEQLLVLFPELQLLFLGQADLFRDHLGLQPDQCLHRNQAQKTPRLVHQNDIFKKVIAVARQRHLENLQQRGPAGYLQTLGKQMLTNRLPAKNRKTKARAQQETDMAAGNHAQHLAPIRHGQKFVRHFLKQFIHRGNRLGGRHGLVVFNQIRQIGEDGLADVDRDTDHSPILTGCGEIFKQQLVTISRGQHAPPPQLPEFTCATGLFPAHFARHVFHSKSVQQRRPVSGIAGSRQLRKRTKASDWPSN